MKLFLTSSFTDVSQYFSFFAKEDLNNKIVTFIPTACVVEEYKAYMNNDRKAFESLGMIVDEIDISNYSHRDIKNTLQKNNFIFIGGGNTFYLLQELKKSGADKLIYEEIKNGKPYIGTSAGSVITAKNILYTEKMDDKNKAKDLENYDSLGLVDFYILPHYNNEPFSESTNKIKQLYAEKINLVAITNTQAICVLDDKFEVIGE